MKFRIDDGTVPQDVEVEKVIEAFTKIHKSYKDCVSKGLDKNICYTKVLAEIIAYFGSATPLLLYDEDFNYLALRGANYEWLVYDGNSGNYKVVKVSEALRRALQE